MAANVAIAKKAADGRARVALDVGPIGELMEPLGTLAFDEAYEIYAQMVRAGEQAGRQPAAWCPCRRQVMSDDS